MRFKLCVWLPLVQLAIAIALTTSNLLRQNSKGNPSWVAPDRQICDGLNAPATVIRYCLLKISDRWFPDIGYRWLDFVIETAIFFALIGFLWYLVSVEISGKNRDKLSVLTAKTGMRALADIVLLAFGITLVLIGQLVRVQFGGSPSPYSNFVSIPYFVWGIVLSLFYGHDLVRYIAQKRS